MNVSAWSIRNPIPAVMLFVLLTFGGLLSFKAMKVQNFPDIDLPTVTVTAVAAGRGAVAAGDRRRAQDRELDRDRAGPEAHHDQGAGRRRSTMIVEFRLEKPVQEAVDDVRSAVARVRSDLPADLRDPIVTKLDLAGQPVLAFTIASTRMDDEALSWFVDNDVSRKLLARARRRRGQPRRRRRRARSASTLDPARLQALGATAADISRQLRQVQTESAGGRTDVGGGEQPVRTLATVQSARRARRHADRAVRTAAASGSTRWRDVSDTIAEPRAAALLDGKPVVGFEVARSRGASEVDGRRRGAARRSTS